jgi:hypothetical protein
VGEGAGAGKIRSVVVASIEAVFLDCVTFRFNGEKTLGDRALAQLAEEDLHWIPAPESNSIAVIIRHMHGNMVSRWTDFLTTDGEKPWRQRDGEFDETKRETRDDVLKLWDDGWSCLSKAIESLKPQDLLKDIVIRGESITALDAIERQLAHYGYHVGQIVYIARMRRGAAWQTLSIARGASKGYRPTKRD